MPVGVPGNSNATARNSAGDAMGGGCARLPRGAQLPLPTREKPTAVYESEWSTLREAMRADLVEAYGSVKVVAEHFDYEETQLSRVLNGQGNPPGWLVAFALWRCKGRRFIAAACDLASGTYEPNPPPSEEEEALAIVRALRERGMESVARGWAGLPARALDGSEP